MFRGWELISALYFVAVAFVVIAVLSIGLAAARIKEICCKRGVAVPSWRRRAATCLGAGTLEWIVWVGVYVVGVSLVSLLFTSLGEHEEVILLLLLLSAMALAFVIINRIIVAKFLPDDQKSLTLRESLSSPSMILLVGSAVSLFFVLSLMSHFRNRGILDAIYYSDLMGIHCGMTMYHEKYSAYPEHLGQLIDEGEVGPKMFRTLYCDETKDLLEGQPYPAPRNFVYLRLPENAPGDIAWIWPQPELSDTGWTRVLYHDGTVKEFKVEDFPAELERSHERLAGWIAEQQGAGQIPSPQVLNFSPLGRDGESASQRGGS